MRHATRDHTRHRHTRRLAGLIALGLMLAAGCAEDDSRIEKCGATNIIRHGEYVLVNDSEEHPDYAQCIFDDPEEGTLGWTWEANNPASQQRDDTTCAYVFFGKATSGEGPSSLVGTSTTPALPISIKNLASLTIDYDVHVSSASHYRLGFSTSDYDCNINFGGCLGASLTIDIYADKPDLYPDNPLESPPFQRRVAVDGEEYDFYKATASYTSSYRFVRVFPSYSGTLNFHAFLDFLDEEGYDENSLKLYEIQHIKFFQRIWEKGSGTTTIQTYSIDVTSSAQ